jgi:hypothetical protein
MIGMQHQVSSIDAIFTTMIAKSCRYSKNVGKSMSE